MVDKKANKSKTEQKLKDKAVMLKKDNFPLFKEQER